MRTVGTKSGPAGQVPYTRSDVYVTRDLKVEIRLVRAKLNGERYDGENRKVFSLSGDVDQLLDMAAQLLGAAQMIMERRQIQ